MSRKLLKEYHTDARHFAFAKAYLEDPESDTYLNPRKSALKAGYSETYASKRAMRILKTNGVRNALSIVRKRLAGKARRSGMIATPKEILEGWTRESRFDPKCLFDESGNIKKPDDLDDETRMSLAGFKVKERVSEDETVLTRKIEYKFPDKWKNRDSLAKHYGLYEADNRQRGTLRLELSDEDHEVLTVAADALVQRRIEQARKEPKQIGSGSIVKKPEIEWDPETE